MLNAGPSGFYKAPVSKFIFTLVTFFTILTALIHITHTCILQPRLLIKQGQWWRIFLHHLPFTSSGEALMGGILLYFTRLFERRYGSAKYASMLTVMCLCSTLIQILFLLTLFSKTSVTLTGSGKNPIYFSSMPSSAPGPYAVIYALLVYYFLEIPNTYRFRFGRATGTVAITMSDKGFVYLLAFQLAITRGKSSIVSAMAGLLTGILYRSNPGNIQHWRYPLRLRRSVTLFLSPFIGNGAGSLSTATTVAAYVPNSSSSLLFPTEDSIRQLMLMGFSREASIYALQQTRNNLQRVTHFLIDGSPSS